MALYAEITLRAVNGKTRIDVQVDRVHNGLHEAVWERTATSDFTAMLPDQLAEAWLWHVLEPFLERMRTDVIEVQADDEAPAAAAREITLDLFELGPLEG